MTAATSDAPSLPSMGRACPRRDPGAAKLGEAQPNMASGAWTGESRGGVKPARPPARNRRHLPGNRLARDILATMERDFMPIHPNDVLGADLIAVVNRLLARGARHLANAPGWRRAKPFPSPEYNVILARAAYVALLKLLDCIEPGLSKRAPTGSPPSIPPADGAVR